jgi:hypothetical protein
VERGRVRAEAEWPSALSPRARAVAGEAVARLGLIEAASGNHSAALGLRDLAQRLLRVTHPFLHLKPALPQLEERVR